MNSDNYVVIMAGGIGSRFWPMSTEKFPKQFHDVLGTGKTLLQMTYERYEAFIPKENIYIVTNELYTSLVKNQINGINDNQVIAEPSRKNTAPCIAYAAYKIFRSNPNANMVVAPSDHLIIKNEEFTTTIKKALDYTSKNDTLVTLGIKPSRPDTGYGYIQFESKDKGEIKKVKLFTEKPNLELANQFIKSGDFYWNSGIFIWNVKTIINALENYLPEVSDLFTSISEDYNTSTEKKSVGKIYQQCPSISIDYGIMEKSENVAIVLSDFGWSDLGTWRALYEHISYDESQNALIGNGIVTYNAENNIIRSNTTQKLVVQGLENYIVVVENDAVLICKKDNEQSIKQFVQDIKHLK